MKSLFIVPVLLMSLMSSPSWALGTYDLVIRAGLFYEKFTATPFTGEVDEGLLRGSFKNGKREGSWEGYWPNGQLMDKTNYKNGKEEGYSEWYWNNGQLGTKGNYKNGKKEGSFEGYFIDGVLNEKLSGTYKNGVKVSD